MTNREREIAELEEEIAEIEEGVAASPNVLWDKEVISRTLARLQAALDEKRKGMKP